jgi:hypothetical protein
MGRVWSHIGVTRTETGHIIVKNKYQKVMKAFYILSLDKKTVENMKNQNLKKEHLK